MTDYNAQLIDLLNEKIRRLEQEKDRQRKEINRQARRIKELEKQLDEALWKH
jgi:peptidoglycan hydrolase CwlO-like protein